ncbi:MAG: glycerophosphodiester phosphodiesterase [Rhodospirillaceae bacterium]|nr:glycerophosphodiester phosphodiesterase [Rhodospirillaceae bacterium]
MKTAFSPDVSRLLPAVVAHRGAPRCAPENTIAAFAAAAAMGARAVECDVRITADGVCVLMHDDTTTRTTGHPGQVEGMKAAAVACLDAGSHWGSAFAGEQVPTLRAALAACAKLGLRPNLEIKGPTGQETRLAAALTETIAASWPSRRPPPLVSSFGPEALAAVGAIAPALPLGLLVHRWRPDTFRRARDLGAVSVHCRQDRLDAGLCRAAKAAGLYVVAYTVNAPGRALALFRQGVHSIITDRPDAMRVFSGVNRRPDSPSLLKNRRHIALE